MSEKKFIEVQVKKINDDWYIGVVTRCDGIERGCGQISGYCATRAEPDWDTATQTPFLWGPMHELDTQPFRIPAKDLPLLRQIVRDVNGSNPDLSGDDWEVIS